MGLKRLSVMDAIAFLELTSDILIGVGQGYR